METIWIKVIKKDIFVSFKELKENYEGIWQKSFHLKSYKVQRIVARALVLQDV